ncbi:hypothetical protein MKZ38_006869 [Zalerion maritima]|uniref:Uncharacterized protein n=1 Tax=Zalerion maritima TaxID=339359 RepID=A0AAD5RJM6_9PEZI|nr:hypothetical protein MKZ38_006869 [Zalerion maritima]
MASTNHPLYSPVQKLNAKEKDGNWREAAARKDEAGLVEMRRVLRGKGQLWKTEVLDANDGVSAPLDIVAKRMRAAIGILKQTATSTSGLEETDRIVLVADVAGGLESQTEVVVEMGEEHEGGGKKLELINRENVVTVVIEVATETTAETLWMEKGYTAILIDSCIRHGIELGPTRGIEAFQQAVWRILRLPSSNALPAYAGAREGKMLSSGKLVESKWEPSEQRCLPDEGFQALLIVVDRMGCNNRRIVGDVLKNHLEATWLNKNPDDGELQGHFGLSLKLQWGRWAVGVHPRTEAGPSYRTWLPIPLLLARFEEPGAAAIDSRPDELVAGDVHPSRVDISKA